MNKINLHFQAEVTPKGVHITDHYAMSKTRLLFDYARFGITQEIAGAFLQSVCDHVMNVRIAGEKLGIGERQLAAHDASKFSLDEFPHYARNFHGDKADPDGFARAWLNHIHHNPHHPEHWRFANDFSIKGANIGKGCLPMPYCYLVEHIADLMGASMSYTGSWDMTNWLVKNMARMYYHPETAKVLRDELVTLGYRDIVLTHKFGHELDDEQ